MVIWESLFSVEPHDAYLLQQQERSSHLFYLVLSDKIWIIIPVFHVLHYCKMALQSFCFDFLSSFCNLVFHQLQGVPKIASRCVTTKCFSRTFCKKHACRVFINESSQLLDPIRNLLLLHYFSLYKGQDSKVSQFFLSF